MFEDELDPLPSFPIAGPALPFGQAMPPVPAPAPSRRGIDWARVIGPLATIALAATGHPNAARGAGQGALHADAIRREQEERDQVFAIQQERIAAQQAQQAAEAEAKRQAAIQTLILQATPQLTSAKTKADYDAGIALFEGLGARHGMRPNTIRALVPWRAPNANDVMAKAAEAFLKNPANKEAIEQGQLTGAIKVDVQGDGTPIDVPVLEVLKAGGVQFDPQTGKPIVLSKKAGASGNVQLDDQVFLGEVAKFETDKGRPATDAERGDIAKRVIEAMAKARKTGTASVVVNTGGGALPQATQRRVDTKTKAFDSQPVVKRVQTMAEAVTFANSLDPNTTNPADDQALIYAFAKAMDPDSVVREGEYKTVQNNAQSWLATLGFNALRVVDNQGQLTPQARQNLKTVILKRYASTRAQYDNLRRAYASQINRITGGTDGDTYLVDYGAAFPDAKTGVQPSARPAAAGPVVGAIVTLRSGQRVRVDKVNADGTFEYTVVR